jgi:predicted O-methyltransferase YrrM
MLACLNKSKSIVECGTSFGVSTIYFAIAASRNALGRRDDAFGVLTIEKDANKVKRAKSI